MYALVIKFLRFLNWIFIFLIWLFDKLKNGYFLKKKSWFADFFHMTCEKSEKIPKSTLHVNISVYIECIFLHNILKRKQRVVFYNCLEKKRKKIFYFYFAALYNFLFWDKYTRIDLPNDKNDQPAKRYPKVATSTINSIKQLSTR